MDKQLLLRGSQLLTLPRLTSQDLRPFDKPKVELEQYPTSASIAARVLSVCEDQFGDVRHKVVVDMGCGAGMLTAAAAVLEADQVIGIDIDPVRRSMHAQGWDSKMHGFDSLSRPPKRGRHSLCTSRVNHCNLYRRVPRGTLDKWRKAQG